MPRPQTISLDAARRVALAAQGFTAPIPVRPDRRALRRVLQHVGLLQIDSVNVVSRSHYLPIFARVGAYDRELLHRAAARRPRLLFEYWAHEASFVPVEYQPLLRWRMQRYRDKPWRIQRENPEFVAWVLSEVKRLGPVTTGDIEHDAPRPTGNWGWNWTMVKEALEYLFSIGEVTSAGRTAGFARLYDLPERVLPGDVLNAPTPSHGDAIREMIRIAARAHGIGTERCLRDYFRVSSSPIYAATAKAAISDLVNDGELVPVTVRGWDEPTYLHRDARLPRKVDARALLSPFDSLVWERTRTESLFGFRYRIEIYTPPPKRVYGYYVLPFLLRDRLVGRVDLKADRQARVLRVHAAWAEPDAPLDTAEELASALLDMAVWSNLGDVVVGDRGDLAASLRAALTSM